MALNHTKKKQKIQVFIPNTTEGILTSKSIIPNLSKINGKLYPPKNSIEVKVLNNTIEEYSLKKKNKRNRRMLSKETTYQFRFQTLQ